MSFEKIYGCVQNLIFSRMYSNKRFTELVQHSFKGGVHIGARALLDM